ncbi:MAG: ChaN family lipoprotein [Cyanobacteriota bacterium]|nr:ChaN family lipoprotein [Cyanobacteriota bacterium]
MSDRTSPPERLTREDILQDLKAADIIYLGEIHDSPADRQGQLEILEALYRENPQMAIGLEMFQRPFQSVLDDYLAGNITEEELRESSEYDSRWGFPWESYAPLLRFAKDRQLPVLALNTPSEITRQVAREGLESLQPEDFEHIPPVAEIDTTDKGYRQMVRSVFDAHHQGGHGNSDSFDRFFAAQVLWDETMAEKIAQFYQANPDTQIVTIAGRGHIVYGYGIPSRVARRLAALEVVGRSVLFGAPDPELTSAGETSESEAIADYFWFD